MSINTFGYNGVFEIRKSVIDKLLTNPFETSLVSEKLDEMTSLDFQNSAGNQAILYVKVGRPTCNFKSPTKVKDKIRNTVNLRIPLGLAMYENGPSGWTKVDNSALDLLKALGGDYPLALGINDLPLEKVRDDEKSLLGTDTDNLQINQISLYLGKSTEPSSDEDINSLLNEFSIDWSALRQRLADELKGDVLNTQIRIPTDQLGLEETRDWNIKIISKEDTSLVKPYESLVLLLHKLGGGGSGLWDDVANTIPPHQKNGYPPYSFSVSLPSDIFSTLIDRKIDTMGWYIQGESSNELNSKDDPYGFMVISSKGKDLIYYLPPPPEGVKTEVKVSTPKEGKVTLSFAQGAFTYRSKVKIKNESTEEETSFSPDGIYLDSNGQKLEIKTFADYAKVSKFTTTTKTVSINALAGHRLSVRVEAVTFPGHYKEMIWRPKPSILDGKIRLEFRYKKIIDWMKDVEDDGYVDIGLNVDHNKAFVLSSYIIDRNIELPWWADALIDLIDMIVNLLSIGFCWNVLSDYIEEQLDKFVNKLDKDLKKKATFPNLGEQELKLFLEEAKLYDGGMILAGYADTGALFGSGRREIEITPLSSKNQLSLLPGCILTYSPIVTSQSNVTSIYIEAGSDIKEFTGTDTPSHPEQFWLSEYQNFLKDIRYVKVDRIELKPNVPKKFWVNSDSGPIKCLVGWDNSKNLLRITWIGYKKRFKPEIQISKNIKHDFTLQTDLNGLGLIQCYKYEGFLSPRFKKIYQTPITREAARNSQAEKWLVNLQFRLSSKQ